MKTIEQRWQDFRLLAIHPDAPAIQISEMRVAFFAGFKSMLNCTMLLAAFDEQHAVIELEKLHNEARRFGELLDKGENA